MLKLMRENAGSWIVKVLLGIIVFVFVLWGVGSVDSNKHQEVATVNGDPISVDEYQEAYQNMIAQVRQRFGNNLNSDMIEMLQLEKETMNRLIDKRLLLQECDKLNIIVTEDELVESIRNTTVFQNNDAFDPNLYRAILRSNNLTPEGFEAMQKQAMTIEKLRSMVVDNVKVANDEITEWFNWRDTKVDIDYLLFSPQQKTEIDPSDEELEAYFKEHGEKYKTPEKARASYVCLDTETYLNEVSVPEQEIALYYDEHQEEFESPKTVAARHILLKVPVEAGEALDIEKKAEIEAILLQAREGKDFAELAKTYSEGPSKANGGYLNAFKYEDMVKPFADKAFAMKPGEISDPVRTQFGWHIIKVEEVNEESRKSLETATPEIREKLKTRMARNKAYNDADAIYNAILNGDDLNQAADTLSLEIKTTDFFARNEPIKGIDQGYKFANIAFNLPVMETSEIEEFDNGYYIIRLDERIDPKIPDLADVAAEVSVDLRSRMQNDAALSDANDILSLVKSGTTLTDAATEKSIPLSSTGLFKRQDQIPDIGSEREISQAAFKLTTPGQVNDTVIKGRKGYYVIALKARQLPAPEALNAEKEDIRDELTRKKEGMLFEEWLAQIKSNSEITIQEGFLD